MTGRNGSQRFHLVFNGRKLIYIYIYIYTYINVRSCLPIAKSFRENPIKFLVSSRMVAMLQKVA